MGDVHVSGFLLTSSQSHRRSRCSLSHQLQCLARDTTTLSSCGVVLKMHRDDRDLVIEKQVTIQAGDENHDVYFL